MAFNRETIFVDDHRSPMALCLSYGEGEDSFQRKKDVESINKTPIPPKTPVKFSPWFRMELERKASVVTFLRDKSKSLPLSDLYNRGHPDSYMNQVFKDATLVGEGHYGKVYRVVSREDGKVYAIKVSKEIFHNESEKLKRFEEVRKHEMVPVHPNCVRLYSAWQEKAKLFIWLEFCDTSLESYAAKNHDIEEDKVWEILLDLLLGLKNLHDNNLIHVDVKLDNILMTSDGVCKLADFGLLIDMSQGSLRLKHAVEGDGRYLAPELLKGGPFSAAADVFSLGLCILELAADIVMPMGGEDWQMLRRGEIPVQKTSHLSSELKAVISNMLTPDHLLRPSVDKLLTQPRLQRMWSERRIKSPLSYSGGFHLSCIKNLGSFLIMLFFVLVKMAGNLFGQVRRQTLRPTIPAVSGSPGCPPGCQLPAPVLRNPNSRLFSRSLLLPSKRHYKQGDASLAGGDSPVSARVAMQLSDEEVEVGNVLSASINIGALASSTPCKPLGSIKGWSSVRRGLCDSVISQRTLDFSQDSENECDSPPNTSRGWSPKISPLSALRSEGDKQTMTLDDSQGAVPLSTSQNSSGVSSTPQLISPVPKRSLLHKPIAPIVGRNLLDSFNSSDEEMSDGERAKKKKRERKKR